MIMIGARVVFIFPHAAYISIVIPHRAREYVCVCVCIVPITAVYLSLLLLLRRLSLPGELKASKSLSSLGGLALQAFFERIVEMFRLIYDN